MVEGKSRVRKKAVVRQNECVACGSCIPVCPRDAIQVIKGMYASVQFDKCVGCGKCAAVCPASVIDMAEANV